MDKEWPISFDSVETKLSISTVSYGKTMTTMLWQSPAALVRLGTPVILQCKQTDDEPKSVMSWYQNKGRYKK